MVLTIRLLGAHAVERDGQPLPRPRGRKVWGLLAYLLLAERPPSRQRLAALLFADADDPLRALRWTLTELRRMLDADPDVVGDDPLVLRLPADAEIDALELASRSGADVAVAAQPAGELLEGLDFGANPAFDAWLATTRRHLTARVQDRLREAAVALLAADRPTDAAELAARVVALDPLRADNQELYLRCLAAGGELRAARGQLARCIDLFRRELGVDPPATLAQACVPSPKPEAPAPRGGVSPASAVQAELDAGRAALLAGAVDIGVQRLRRAAALAAAPAARHLYAQALVELAQAMVHGVGARDAEPAALLQRALRAAEAAGSPVVATRACTELGFLEVQAGRHERATAWLDRAESRAQGSDELCAAILGVRGMGLSDTADYQAALATLRESVERAQAADRRRQASWSLSLIGRVHLLRGDLRQAAEVLDSCLAIVRADRWTAFLPWPQALAGHVRLGEGQPEAAAAELEHALALADQLRDPCWRATATRGLALVDALRHRDERARHWIEEATGYPVPYAWVRGWVLDAACAVTAGTDPDATRGHADELEVLAARAGMRELTVRAHLHLARLGVYEAAAAAGWLAEGIDNPALARLAAATPTRR
jgi:DNA-binding SARP family transcriptional activator